ncbi:MAG: TRAP transporter small permease subunit [Rhodovarius sp.]|nr:TRAP transporter small permease subunit [Rhodovarius sp.]MDW8315889.1 TRAP transporter small permease subunit [Rhodovarius sp.]
MRAALAFSRWVDWLSTRCGRLADWAVLLACLVSAGNAFLRYGASVSNNALLEAQWYFFAAMVMLGASYTLLRNEHVRVDLFYGWVGHRGRLWIDILGLALFLLPGMALLAWMTWPFFLDSWLRNEHSPNPGGLLRWPVKLLLPVGFALMVAQGLSELIKRIAVLRGIEMGEGAFLEYRKPEQ